MGKDSHDVGDGGPATPRGEIDASGLLALLSAVKAERGFDLGGYKRSTVMRRVQRRIEALGLSSFDEYRARLARDADEFSHLCDTVFINVTSFFRDPLLWRFLEESVVPRVLEERPAGEPIRAWSAGCATGEEAYSLAMLFAEALGASRVAREVTIYATDIDDGAIAIARQATYGAPSVHGVPAPLLEKYFVKVGERYVFDEGLRGVVLFGRHDLRTDAPPSSIDVALCRNTLMYFDIATQSRLLSGLHRALSARGVLVVGNQEMLFGHEDLFTPVDPKRRVLAPIRDADRARPLPRRTEGAAVAAVATPARETARLERALRAAHEELGVACGQIHALSEELAKSHGELRSTAAELEAIKEELLSTDGELQATHDGLDAMTEHFRAVNGELERRGGELRRVNSLLESFLTRSTVG